MQPVGDPYWRPARLWSGQTCVILGGGPSLTLPDLEYARARVDRVVAINNAYLIAPQADMFYFCDRRWWDWHCDNPKFRAVRRRARAGRASLVTRENRDLAQIAPELRCLQDTGRWGYDPAPGCVRNGRNSGYQALHLAAQLGVSRAVLLGFDMQVAPDGRAHWHAEHPVQVSPSVFRRLFIRGYETLAAELGQRGVEVVNCSPSSALTAFPRRALRETLGDLSRNPIRPRRNSPYRMSA